MTLFLSQFVTIDEIVSFLENTPERSSFLKNSDIYCCGIEKGRERGLLY